MRIVKRAWAGLSHCPSGPASDPHPRIEGCDYVFAGRNEGHFWGGQHGQVELGRRHIGEAAIAPWRFHDLRRTARSLMARIGIPTELAKRILGHVQPSIVEIYNGHDYLEEKRAALAKLARTIELILLPLESNVVNYASMRRLSGGLSRHPAQKRHCWRLRIISACGRSSPMNTKRLSRRSLSVHAAPAPWLINWWTPWKIILRSSPTMCSTPL
jgi:hypothetical protein